MSINGVTLNFTPSQTFRYDPAGNRLEVTDNGMTLKYQPNEANPYTRIEIADAGAESVIVEPQFDPLGNLLQDDRNTYT
jgi:YD repeat-containing protein